ncbi:MAG: carbohydrate ABC transporter permease [Deinococcota bacterium]
MLELKHPVSKLIFWGSFALLASFIFFPLFWMLSTSFKPQGELFERLPSLLPRNFTLANYSKALTRGSLPRYLLNSFVAAGGSALFTTITACYAAFSFAKYRYWGRAPLMYLLISARMFPLALILVALFPMFGRIGLTNTYLGLILAYVVLALPAATYILYSYFVQIPSDLMEAARVDGASEMRILHTIIVPLALPALVTVALYGFIWGWNDLLFSLTLVTSESMRTIGPGLLFTYLGEFAIDWGGAMAASVITSLPIVVVFMALQRFFVQGLTAGAVKS